MRIKSLYFLVVTWEPLGYREKGSWVGIRTPRRPEGERHGHEEPHRRKHEALSVWKIRFMYQLFLRKLLIYESSEYTSSAQDLYHCVS
jgi:hypothetical protein